MQQLSSTNEAKQIGKIMFDFKVTTKYHATTGEWSDTLATGKSSTVPEVELETQVFFYEKGYYVWYEGFEAMLTRFKV